MARWTLIWALLVAGASMGDEMPDSGDEVNKGLGVAQLVAEKDQGFHSYKADGLLTLRSPSGNEVTRSFTMHTYEMTNDGDKRLINFNSPRDVEGTTFLIHAHGLDPDDQWIYLPVLKRTKRVASRDKTGAFMGSEFALEDISGREIQKYTYRYLADEEVDGNAAVKLENTPAYPFSGYSKLHEWIDKTIYHPRKVLYFDRNGEKLKELTFHDYREYGEGYWRPAKMVMKNLKNGNESVIEWSRYDFGVDLSEGNFHPRYINRRTR